MTESLAHKNLKIQAKQILLQEGYLPEKILLDKFWFEQELNGQTLRFRVDVYAANGVNKVIECGNFPKWKRPYYNTFFGKENVRHIPHEPKFGKYLLHDTTEKLDDNQAKQFMVDMYNRYIFAQFKNDETFEFMEFNTENRDKFDADNHRKVREINPDHTTAPESLGRNIWMNFPNAKINSKQDYMEEIHWGMIYYSKTSLKVVILMNGKEACKKFVDLSTDHHRKILAELNKLPPGFKIRQGNSFWLDVPRRPLDKNWEDPLECHDLTWEDYESILLDEKNLCLMQGQNVGPTMELVGAYVRPEDLPEAIFALKPLYKLLLKPDTKVDELCRKIKEIKVSNPNSNWRYYLAEGDRKFLRELYTKQYGEVDPSLFNKAFGRLKEDPEFVEYSKQY